MPRVASMILAAALVGLVLAMPAPASAERVTTRDAFLGLVQGRALTATGIRLEVTPDGRIGGRAFGSDVRGTWEWDAGWFCRTLGWGRREWPLDCQLVVRDGDRLIFTAAKGTGERATLRLR